MKAFQVYPTDDEDAEEDYESSGWDDLEKNGAVLEGFQGLCFSYKLFEALGKYE